MFFYAEASFKERFIRSSKLLFLRLTGSAINIDLLFIRNDLFRYFLGINYSNFCPKRDIKLDQGQGHCLKNHPPRVLSVINNIKLGNLASLVLTHSFPIGNREEVGEDVSLY